ncbi:MAG: hypothetical protein IT440_15315, partial [Phycisphaeraceae bacterium]|nr:hypothetical protein [Phycisphaeraceae bacterium]
QDHAGESYGAQWVFLRDSDVYLGLYPLTLTHTDRPARMIEVRKIGPFQAVTFNSYAGPARDFSAVELRQICGGFAFCIGSAREWGNFAAFRQSCREIVIEDSLYQCLRRIRCLWGRHGVDMLYDVQCDDMVWAKINGTFLEDVT